MEYIAFDAHKRYTQVSVETEDGQRRYEGRIDHVRGALQQFLTTRERGSPVALETVGNWYWIVDEIEAAGQVPQLVHARKAKLMLGMVNKTDKLDARGLNRLQRTGTLPTVWIPPGALRDQRDLPRTRMVLTRERTRLKNRIHATLAKYGLRSEETSDLFGRRGRQWLQGALPLLPPHSRYATERLLEQLDVVSAQIEGFEQRVRAVFAPTLELQLLRTLPGVGWVLAVVILLEIGDIARFPSAAQLAAYAGTTPRVHASGGRTHYGQLRVDINRYLKWAFVEAANTACVHRQARPPGHVRRLYARIQRRKGHPKAVGAVARHLAEATYWILSKREPYREPAPRPASSTEGPARSAHERATLGI
jgi:transposase